jgi:hypothetical protein
LLKNSTIPSVSALRNPAALIETQHGKPASRLGFASQYTQDATCIPAAFEAGIKYFFDYQLPKEPIWSELRLLTTDQKMLIANMNAIVEGSGGQYAAFQPK